MTQISILGCGWLGLPLAKSLSEKGFKINGSSTSESKIAILQNFGIVPYLISITEEKIHGNITGFLAGSKILIIDIPPKIRGENGDFISKVKSFIPIIEAAGIKKVLFVSSTSVYGDRGETITEQTIPNPQTESGKQIFEAEKLLAENQKFETTIIRFAGLVGEDRHPVFHLSGKSNLENPLAPVNLIHQKDCIGLIEAIIDKDIWGEVVNGVTPYHPSMKDYYTQKAIDLGLPIPEFQNDGAKGKIISSHKAQSILEYSFRPELLP